MTTSLRLRALVMIADELYIAKAHGFMVEGFNLGCIQSAARAITERGHAWADIMQAQRADMLWLKERAISSSQREYTYYRGMIALHSAIIDWLELQSSACVDHGIESTLTWFNQSSPELVIRGRFINLLKAL